MKLLGFLLRSTLFKQHRRSIEKLNAYVAKIMSQKIKKRCLVYFDFVALPAASTFLMAISVA